MNKKLISICALVAMAALVIAGASMAYFSDTVETKGNVLTSGNVDISITETIPDAEAAQTLSAGESFTRTFTITNDGTSDAYVRLKVTSEKGIYAFELNDDSKNNSWTVNEGENGVYYYNYNYLVTDDNPITITLKITVNSELKEQNGLYALANDEYDLSADDILGDYKIVAEAIQTTGFADAETAFEAFDGENAAVTTSATE